MRKYIKHGMTGTKIYNVWKSMRARCLRSTSQSYKYYGGKGITICDGWSSFIAFKDWAMANGYAEGLTIDRVDNSKNYTPDNCEWITRAENSGKDNAGELHWKNKLSSANVLEIRRLYAVGDTTHRKLAKAFGLNPSHVAKIVTNEIWRSV